MEWLLSYKKYMKWYIIIWYMISKKICIKICWLFCILNWYCSIYIVYICIYKIRKSLNYSFLFIINFHHQNIIYVIIYAWYKISSHVDHSEDPRCEDAPRADMGGFLKFVYQGVYDSNIALGRLFPWRREKEKKNTVTNRINAAAPSKLCLPCWPSTAPKIRSTRRVLKRNVFKNDTCD